MERGLERLIAIAALALLVFLLWVASTPSPPPLPPPAPMPVVVVPPIHSPVPPATPTATPQPTATSLPTIPVGQLPLGTIIFAGWLSQLDGDNCADRIGIFQIVAGQATAQHLTNGCEPAVSPDGRFILLRRMGQLYLLERTTGQQRQLTQELVRTVDYNTWSWSPDGGAVAYGESEGISILDLATLQQQVIPGAGAAGVVWSPDGQWLASYGNEEPNGQYSIYVQGLAYEQPIRLTEGTQPRWFPDSTHLLYQVQNGNAYDFWSIGRNGQGARYLATGMDASISPDGQDMVYSIATARGSELTLLHPDGRHERLAMVLGRSAFDLTWSPDGQYLAFSSSQTTGDDNPYDNPDLFVIRKDGTGLMRLTRGARVFRAFTWINP